uniref:Uncharacterized protein n=1 Tax=Timema cristinae TaxID=61476 RepID=A0A7R9CQU5_TIMCR|nr:unnamed protein product [Timema cristinae]
MAARTLPGFEQCDELDAREWFESDGNDPGYQHLNDDEIVHQVIEDNDNGSNVRESDDDEEMDAEEAAGPSHSDAYEAFQTAMNWLERQPEGTATQLVLLKRLRDMAAKKHLGASPNYGREAPPPMGTPLRLTGQQYAHLLATSHQLMSAMSGNFDRKI